MVLFESTHMCLQFRLFTHVISEADCFRAFLHKKSTLLQGRLYHV